MAAAMQRMPGPPERPPGGPPRALRGHETRRRLLLLRLVLSRHLSRDGERVRVRRGNDAGRPGRSPGGRGSGRPAAPASPAAAAPQAAQTCPVLHLAIGAVNLNVLGL